MPRAKTKKPRPHTATTLVRVSQETLTALRREAQRRDMTLRALADAALRAYVGSGA
jgi:signal transduction histidine kinase